MWADALCPLCERDNDVWLSFPYVPWEVIIKFRKCASCGMVYQSPVKTDWKVFYKSEYRELIGKGDGTGPIATYNQTKRAEILLDFIGPHFKNLESMLDIGCGLGYWIEKVRKAYDAHAVGVEIGDAQLKYLERKNIKTHTEVPQGKFQLISMVHVLEHINRPVEYILDLPEHEYLLVEVPNVYGEPSALQPWHPVLFCEATLKD